MTHCYLSSVEYLDKDMKSYLNNLRLEDSKPFYVYNELCDQHKYLPDNLISLHDEWAFVDREGNKIKYDCPEIPARTVNIHNYLKQKGYLEQLECL